MQGNSLQGHEEMFGGVPGRTSLTPLGSVQWAGSAVFASRESGEFNTTSNFIAVCSTECL